MDIEPKKPTIKGPADWFTGDVWIDSIVEPRDDSPLNIGAVHFTPGAHTAWHSHAGGQTLYVIEGRGGHVYLRYLEFPDGRQIKLLADRVTQREPRSPLTTGPRRKAASKTAARSL